MVEEKKDTSFLIHAEIKKTFKLPIIYDNDKMDLAENIVSDLELVKSSTPNNKSIYTTIFKPTNCFGETIVELIPLYYTTNTKFLTDTQNLIKTVKFEPLISIKNSKEIITIWNELRNDIGFLQKYSYIDFEKLNFLNENVLFLQVKNLFGILSPVVSLLLPLIIMIIPFLVLKIKFKPVTIALYIQVLSTMIAKHAIFKLFQLKASDKLEEKVYAVGSALVYVFTVYQNIMSCKNFYANMIEIHDKIFKLKDFVNSTLEQSKIFLKSTENLSTYTIFNSVLTSKMEVLLEIKTQMDAITSFCLNPKQLFLKSLQLGQISALFYKLHKNDTYNDAMIYGMGFLGYVDNLVGLKTLHINKTINATKFIKNKSKSKFKGIFYPSDLENKKLIKNNYKFNKNVLLSGVNAGGKTTLLKSVLINTILSQQYGFGFYKNCLLYPFKFIQCYLNIIDDGDRLSLFEKECQKCKNILDNVNENSKDTHLCVFDELFSGTNTEEAVVCGFNLLMHLNKNNKVHFLLTTHYNELCEKIEKNDIDKKTITKKMESGFNTNGDIKHTYKIKNGINSVKGGLEILKKMNFPENIFSTIL